MGTMMTRHRGPPSPGCFWAVGATQDFSMTGEGFLWAPARAYDCDCRTLRLCPPGPPPMPPLEEFMATESTLDNYAHCPASLANSLPLPGDQPWTANGGWDEVDEKFKREEKDSRSEAYLDIVADALTGMPGSERNALEEGLLLPLLFNGTVDASAASALADDVEAPSIRRRIVAPLILRLLLADPDLQAQELVASLPTELANVVLRCTERAVNNTLKRIQSPAAAPGRRVQGQGAARPESEAGSASDYRDYMASLATLWKDHTPAGLSRENIGGQVTLSAHHNGSWLGGFAVKGVGTVDDMCDRVYQHAIQNAERARPGERYVASFSRVMAALWGEALETTENSFLEAMRLPNGTGEHLDWDEEKLKAVFGPSFPAVAVAINFITLSLHTGQTETLDGGTITGI